LGIIRGLDFQFADTRSRQAAGDSFIGHNQQQHLPPMKNKVSGHCGDRRNFQTINRTSEDVNQYG